MTVDEIHYQLPEPLDAEEESWLLKFIFPYTSSLDYNTETRKLVGFGIYADKHFWYRLAVVDYLRKDDDVDV